MYFPPKGKMNKLSLYSTIASSFIYASAFSIKTLEKRLTKLFIQTHSRLFRSYVRHVMESMNGIWAGEGAYLTTTQTSLTYELQSFIIRMATTQLAD